MDFVNQIIIKVISYELISLSNSLAFSLIFPEKNSCNMFGIFL
jgi:hypothetical protein